MRAWKVIPLAVCMAATLGMGGCAALAGGAAGGAAGYEYSNKKALDQNEADYKAGKITKKEYDRRKEEIEGRSAVQ